jgi:hypothetical protein
MKECTQWIAPSIEDISLTSSKREVRQSKQDEQEDVQCKEAQRMLTLVMFVVSALRSAGQVVETFGRGSAHPTRGLVGTGTIRSGGAWVWPGEARLVDRLSQHVV